MSERRPETISPTAHYTGYVWFAHGQSHEAFATPAGRLMYQALRAPNLAAQVLGWPTLEGMLIARHKLIDARLEHAIATGEIGQVIEVACGLSPRGWRFRTRHGDRVTYVEADLPGMLSNKRRILAQLGGETAHHRTAEINALADDGAHSIDALCGSLDPTVGTAIITEGLVNYFDAPTVEAMWRRFSRALGRFPRGLYLSDLILRDTSPLITGFSWLLSAFVRGKVHMHYASSSEAAAALHASGFDAELLDPRDLPDVERAGASRVKIIEAALA